jgi:hypothetical protein
MSEAKDGFVDVEGNAVPARGTKDSKSAKEVALEALGFRVSGVGLKETEDGSSKAVATVVGVGAAAASELIPALGREVDLRTAADGRRQVGMLHEINFRAGKDGKPGSVRMKIGGGRGLDAFIGVQIKVAATQGALFDAAASMSNGKPCRECGHGWNTQKPKKRADGHRRETGKCVCGCVEMKI